MSRITAILDWLGRLTASRSSLHVRVTEHPTAASIIQRLREAFPYDAVPGYIGFDNEKTYGTDVLAAIERMGIGRKQITPYRPWQNGAAQRWVETVRRDLLDHVIVLNERHLQPLLAELIATITTTGRISGWARPRRR